MVILNISPWFITGNFTGAGEISRTETIKSLGKKKTKKTVLKKRKRKRKTITKKK